MPVKKTTPPKQTIFSINKKTGQPFMTIELAESLIAKHVYTYAKHLLYRDSIEDVIQEFLMAFCVSNYDHKKGCSPTTFCIMMMRSTSGKLSMRQHRAKDTVCDKTDDNGDTVVVNGNKSRIKAKVFSETVWVNEDGMLVSNFDSAPDYVTPLEVVLAKEKVETFIGENMVREDNGLPLKAKPIDYNNHGHQGNAVRNQVIPPGHGTKKRCSKCNKNKDYIREFGTDRSRPNNKAIWCKKCNYEVNTSNKRKRDKRKLKDTSLLH